jgi:16S rRNA G966 N2-methylase RsmD
MSFQHLLREEVIRFIEQHQHDDVNTLALKVRQFSDLPMADILRQIGVRQKARGKLPTWLGCLGVVFPVALSLEQSSSETTAHYKAALVSGSTLVDLTGGFGVDAFYFAQQVGHVIHVERNAELSAIAAHNFGQLGAANIVCVNEEAESFLTHLENSVDWVYLDPARRDSINSKVHRLEDCEPDVLRLLPTLLQKSRNVLLKTSPMLDIDLALQQLRSVVKVIVLAMENECKEVLYQLSEEAEAEPLIMAVNLDKEGIEFTFSFRRSEERNAEALYSEPLRYVYEPNVALLKAGAFQSLAQRLGLFKLHPHTHLYTSETLLPDFPGRTFHCEKVTKLDKKALLGLLPEKKANITVRNFPMTVADIRKQTGIREGGDVYLLATTDLHNRKVVLVCRKVVIIKENN